MLAVGLARRGGARTPVQPKGARLRSTRFRSSAPSESSAASIRRVGQHVGNGMARDQGGCFHNARARQHASPEAIRGAVDPRQRERATSMARSNGRGKYGRVTETHLNLTFITFSFAVAAAVRLHLVHLSQGKVQTAQTDGRNKREALRRGGGEARGRLSERPFSRG